MKLLPAPSGEFRLATTPLSHMHLWHAVTFSGLLHYNLACLPYKLNGEWTAALTEDQKAK